MDKKQIYNFEVSDNNFEQVVLHNSQTLPVLVLFMSPSDPVCIALGNTLINYASEFAGQFILARYDMDMYTNIAQQYNITKLPTIAMVQNAAIDYQINGHPSEADLIDLFKRFHITNPAKELRLQGVEKHAQGKTAVAVQLLTQGIKLDPSNTKIAMDMCQNRNPKNARTKTPANRE